MVRVYDSGGEDVGKEQKIVATQIRLGEDLYEYAKKESERLFISLNAALNCLIDDGRRWREAQSFIRVEPQ